MAVSVGYINYQPIPRFPGMSRDIALEVDQNIPAADLLSTIHAHGGNILKIHLSLMYIRRTFRKR